MVVELHHAYQHSGAVPGMLDEAGSADQTWQSQSGEILVLQVRP